MHPDDHNEKPRRQYSIHFYIESVPFTEDVIKGRTSLGGSESACITTAKGLAERGHLVQMHAANLDPKCDGLSYDGVSWHSLDGMYDRLMLADADSFTALRIHTPFAHLITAKHTALWNQDLLIDTSVLGFVPQIDQLFYVSDYQRRQWEHRAQDLKLMDSAVVMNPIETHNLPGAKAKKQKGPRYVVHTSRPERGYDAMVRLWPHIKRLYPDLKLKLCRYSSMYDAGGWGRICKEYEDMITRLGDVEFVGELNKRDLYRLIAGAACLWYPTSQAGFAETNCITATEAAACRTPMIADSRGALPETLPDGAGVLLDGNTTDGAWKSDTYRDRTIDAFKRVLGPGHATAQPMEVTQEAYETAVSRNRQAAAFEWERRLDKFFDERFRSNKVRVLRHLMHDDNHAAAKILAGELQDEHRDAEDQTIYVEAVAAENLCDDVIAQRAQTAADYADHALQDPAAEANGNVRLHTAAEKLLQSLGKDGGTVLDLPCGNGAFALVVLAMARQAGIPVDITCVDYSAELIGMAEKAVREHLDPEQPAPDFVVASADEFINKAIDDDTKYDAVFCGEFLEHVEKPWELIDRIEAVTAKDGRALITTPLGPFSEMLDRRTPRLRGHVHSFTTRDINAMFGDKKMNVEFMPAGVSPKSSESCGFWIIDWQPGGGAAKPLDYRRLIETERPYESVHAVMITRNAAGHLAACLESLAFCDDIHIYDSGSTDLTLEIAADYKAKVTSGDWPNNFAEARNRSLKLAKDAGADWVLWIDGDEQLHGGPTVRWFTRSGSPFNGYVIRQHHLHIDMDQFFDKPCRLFRVDPKAPPGGENFHSTKFYGVVHEQPGMDLNLGVVPALQVDGINISHMGYVDSSIRATKAGRNYGLLQIEIAGKGPHPPRDMAWALWMRDLVQHAGRQNDPKDARRLLIEVINVYKRMGWNDPEKDPGLHEVAWPFYQVALQQLGRGIAVRSGTVAQTSGEVVDPKIERFLAADADEAEMLLAWRAKQAVAGTRRPDTLLV